MTQFKPTLIINHLLVRRGTETVYDAGFRKGVNVIRGENSSGKSTIMNFLFYSLGGDLSDWSKHALLCDETWVEVELNGSRATLRREISETSLTAMFIYSGGIEEALNAPAVNWRKYNYIRGSNVESFSQVLFRLLEMPDVASDQTGNITMHQVLRLLYADQLSPTDEIFRFETRDHPDLRETVGNLLCGAYENDVYEFQQLLRKKEAEYNSTHSELVSIITVLSDNSDAGTSVEWVETKKKDLVRDREETLAAIEKAEAAYYSREDADRITLKAQNDAYKLLQKRQTEFREHINAIDTEELNIADADDYIRSLHAKREALLDAEDVAEVVQTVRFGTCPACHAEVLEDDETAGACHLCKTPFDRERARDRIVGLLNDVSIQLKQSEMLQERRKNNLTALEAKTSEKRTAWRRAAKDLELLQVLPTTKAREELRQLQRSLGYIDRELEDIENKLKLAAKMDELRDRKRILNDDIETLRDQIATRRTKHTSQIQNARKSVETEIKKLLQNDLKRQDSFENPESVEISFRKNRITVDEQSYFSASSRVILKSSFFLGFLAAATKNASFRHPRFLLIDTIEDKGMEPIRSHNFQDEIVRVSSESEVEHQVIYATSMPSPNLSEEMLVGQASSRLNGTLRISSGSAAGLQYGN